ncbi:AMP-binding protein [uncultured Aquincola sp.]|uniref:AMP-binding protein n=1 Tax=uncultured Aquincola sp. TaxID=886556 RepID=UPI0032B10833|tara:strand:+ start:1073 stop:2506 length:1434 start_codon:yes stop_codon:yes gene_type:complete
MIALSDDRQAWTREALDTEVQALAHQLQTAPVRVLATLMDNGPAWAVADLAAAQAGVVHIPLPLFFTPAQVGHALQAAGVDALLMPPQAAAARFNGAPQQPCIVAGQPLSLVRTGLAPVAMPAGTTKITFTSGSTGTPKGVCLGGVGIDAVVQGLVQALAPLNIERHLCALPLAVLLENIAGLLAPLAAGAECRVLPLQQVGLAGSSGFDPAQFHQAVQRHAPHSLILLPQMLTAWVAFLAHTGQRAPTSLRMVAVGGAAVGERLLAAARALGIPAYEGYGLSEGASVQTLNLPGADRPHSAGRALPHARLRISASGEIEIGGSLMLGYLGDATAAADWWPTGDLGRLDDDGYLQVQGRRKNLLITAFGRNVSPEWVETALLNDPALLAATVFGDGQPALSAVLWPMPGAGDAQLQRAVDAANATLPDYARVAHWVRGAAPFNAASGLATANGRPQRAAIHQAHAEALQAAGAAVLP